MTCILGVCKKETSRVGRRLRSEDRRVAVVNAAGARVFILPRLNYMTFSFRKLRGAKPVAAANARCITSATAETLG